MYKKDVLQDKEKILLSRVYKLDRQIDTFMRNHKGSMNKLILKTDFIQRANELYSLMDDKLIDISLKRTKYVQNLVSKRKN